MGKFKVGQWVRALVDWDSAKTGGVYKVTNGPSEEVWIEVPGSCDHFMFDYEVEPWTPRVGERVRVVKTFYDSDELQPGAVGTVKIHHHSTIYGVLIEGGGQLLWSYSAEDLEPLPAAEAPPAKLQIEAGKFYKTRDGRKAGPALHYDGNPKEYCWRVPSDGLGHFVYTSDGRYSTDGYWPENDLVAEWVEPASNDNAPVATQPASKPPKFKVGDRVKHPEGWLRYYEVVKIQGDVFYIEVLGQQMSKRAQAFPIVWPQQQHPRRTTSWSSEIMPSFWGSCPIPTCCRPSSPTTAEKLRNGA